MSKPNTTTAPEWHQTEFDFKLAILPNEVANDIAIHGKAKSNDSDANLRTEKPSRGVPGPKSSRNAALRTFDAPRTSIFGDQSRGPTS